ncbi:DUF3037 domain-containing protein [Heyndrickxia oleronia]|uniref:DUF3037 domain-containing protein n=1 Tax=Heyndrickxia oleronia TaxID=38875 RepID=UPI001B01B111|nr:DUF3037 domain-containing protein [Heyndrickxia oleronia]GIN38998.1 hypothetical protein J19TS1_19470 [Heyndrickxia oleronia]
MERKPYWYSVIQYYPSTLRGEVLNVGIMLNQPESGLIKFHILDVGNIKLRGLLTNPVNYETYRVQKEFIEFYLEKLTMNDDLLRPNIFSQTFLSQLNNELPSDFRLSEPTITLTNNPDQLFNKLLISYIGSDFLKLDDSQQTTTKKYVKKYFDDRQLIDRKIKSNVKFTPIKDVENMHFLIDFVYKNGVINFMQAVPSNKDHFTNWFTKINTITSAIQRDSGFYLLFDSNDALNDDKTVSQTLSYLKSKDQRIHTLDIHSKRFDLFCKKIEDEGKDIEDFESELLILQGA